MFKEFGNRQLDEILHPSTGNLSQKPVTFAVIVLGVLALLSVTEIAARLTRRVLPPQNLESVSKEQLDREHELELFRRQVVAERFRGLAWLAAVSAFLVWASGQVPALGV